MVRRRVAQRMASLNEGMAAAVPHEAELQAWLRTHPVAYRIAPRYSLQQVYFDPRRRGARLKDDIEAARMLLSRDDDATPGDVTLLPANVNAMAAGELASVFGSAFVHALEHAPLGQWSGPVGSGFGTHLVRVNARTPARLPALAEVRDDVERDWLRDRTQRADRAYLAALRKHYTIEMDADLAKAITADGNARRPTVRHEAVGPRVHPRTDHFEQRHHQEPPGKTAEATNDLDPEIVSLGNALQHLGQAKQGDDEQGDA